MVIDTSALIAVLEGEPAAPRLIAALDVATELRVSAATVLEAGIVIEVRRGEAAGRELDLLLQRLGVEIVSVTTEHVEYARDAYRRFGKARHPAGLNFADCFGYALAVALDEPLLFVGDDFARTDVRVVEY